MNFKASEGGDAVRWPNVTVLRVPKTGSSSLMMGVALACAAFVAVFSSDLLLPESLSSRAPLKVWRYLCYLPWLLYQVVLANIHVVYLVIFPPKIRPQIVRVKTGLPSDLALATRANSITGTPGTITRDVNDGELCVHALSDKAAAGLRAGDMERRVAHVFLESARAETRSTSARR